MDVSANSVLPEGMYQRFKPLPLQVAQIVIWFFIFRELVARKRSLFPQSQATVQLNWGQSVPRSPGYRCLGWCGEYVFPDALFGNYVDIFKLASARSGLFLAPF